MRLLNHKAIINYVVVMTYSMTYTHAQYLRHHILMFDILYEIFFTLYAYVYITVLVRQHIQDATYCYDIIIVELYIFLNIWRAFTRLDNQGLSIIVSHKSSFFEPSLKV
jgi:hypothetical protein